MVTSEIKALKKLYSRYKASAKTRDIPFYLDLEEFYSLTQKECHYCGIEPCGVINLKDSFLEWNGIDRIDSNKNYSEGNTVPCCRYCNRAKSNLSVSTFEWWLNMLVDQQIKLREASKNEKV